MAYPYVPAFIAFCVNGAPPEEIAEEFKIPLKSLQAKIRQEGWRSLANRIAGRITADSTPNDDALNRIEANRAKNYEAAADLRVDLMEIITRLCAGTLRIKKQFQHKGQIVEYEAEPSITDRLNIAVYAQTVAEMGYRALGDHAANGGYKADASPGTPPRPSQSPSFCPPLSRGHGTSAAWRLSARRSSRAAARQLLCRLCFRLRP